MSDQSPSDTYVHRIQALLDKAESTDFPEEADALLAKAQELMSRHAIDEAMLEAAGSGAVTEEIGSQDVIVRAPYASAKTTLLGAVAHANRCRVVSRKGPSGTQYCSVVGYESDLANVNTLFVALSFQAVRFMLQAEVPAHDTPRRFRHSFLVAYAMRIGERLREAEHAATEQAEHDLAAGPGRLHGADGGSVALVLASRSEKVDEAFHRANPNLRYRKVSVSSGAGYGSGRSAADRASLNQRGLNGARPQLPA